MLLFFASICIVKNNKVNKYSTLEAKQNMKYHNSTNSGFIKWRGRYLMERSEL